MLSPLLMTLLDSLCYFIASAHSGRTKNNGRYETCHCHKTSFFRLNYLIFIYNLNHLIVNPLSPKASINTISYILVNKFELQLRYL